MKLIGHELVPYEPLFWRENADQIKTDEQNLFKFDKAMIKAAELVASVRYLFPCFNLSLKKGR